MTIGSDDWEVGAVRKRAPCKYKEIEMHCRNNGNLTPNLVADDLPLFVFVTAFNNKIIIGRNILNFISGEILASKIVSEYDQEIPQSQTADNPMA